MRVLNVEDNPMKHYQIKRALEYCGAKNVVCRDNLEEGLQTLKETMRTDKHYDLVVTDMNYPLQKGGESCGQAGEILIETRHCSRDIRRRHMFTLPTGGNKVSQRIFLCNVRFL